MRVRNVLCVMVLASLIPVAGSAQGGMGGGGMGRGGGRRGGGGGGQQMDRTPPKFPSANDLQKFNPAALLIDKKKKLSLPDSTVASLTALQSKIYERNGDLMARYDSAQRAFHPSSNYGTANDTGRTQTLVQMRGLRSLLDSLSDRRGVDVKETLDLIANDKQKLDAAKLLDKQDSDFADKMPQVPGTGDRNGRSGRP